MKILLTKKLKIILILFMLNIKIYIKNSLIIKNGIDVKIKKEFILIRLF
jgi:hypothetical protein